MERESNLFVYNERQANKYTTICLLVASGIAGLMWVLNILGFFIVDKKMMNIIMPIGIVCMLAPFVIELLKKYFEKVKISDNVMKYIIMSCFLFGIGSMSSVLTLQMVLVWACPIILSCHYYNPKFTMFTFLGVLVCMLISFYLGIYVGVWDANIMHESTVVNGFSERVAFVKEAKELGDNILLRGFNFYYLPRAVILSFVAVVGVMLSNRTQRLLTKQNEIVRTTEQMEAELSVASNIQSSLLPAVCTLGKKRNFDIFASMNPAKEVGGDFYDFFMVDESHLAVVMADVSGKGVPAALFMMMGKTLIKDHTKPGIDLGEVFSKVNNMLCENNEKGLFITAFEGVLNLETGELNYVNAGHEPPLIALDQGDYQFLNVKPGFVLAGMENVKYKTHSIKMNRGDKMFLYTDGVTDANNMEKQFFGMDRLKDVLNDTWDKTPEQVVEKVKEEINGFSTGATQFDDITMLCFEYGEKRK